MKQTTPSSAVEKFSVFGLRKTSEHTTMAVLAVVVGLAAGFGAVGFRYLINFFSIAGLWHRW